MNLWKWMMKNKINELNKLYEPSIEKIEQIRKILLKNCIDHAILFSNNHHIKIEDEIESVKYPIPNIICQLDGIKTKIGIDLATDLDYIGFVKFTLKKEQFKIFKFDAIKHFKFEVYGFYFYQYYQNEKDLDNLKINVANSAETTLNVKIEVSNIDEIISIISSLSTAPKKESCISSYTCDCGHEISIDTYYGQCPICGEDSPSRRKFKTKCPVCASITLKDEYGNGECKTCGWKFDSLSKKYKNSVIYPNLISLNKAKKLFNEGKPFTPDFNDFVAGFNCYGEMEFAYKGVTYVVMGTSNDSVEFGEMGTDTFEVFKDINEFAEKAKVNEKLVKDIWSEVENVNWLQ